ncbi:TetR/AcrR family transcriptional regulator [Nonomuraea sp. NPDC046802]|uniref:TetR/AcrR family transcriptional regulator n=1 Tax=Nonomuraea sp. NPDC046802 TaxID=3154919 RepID=UPI00340E6B98
MERADAARNRAKILKAAVLLFAEKPPQDVTMNNMAHKAGVGRGTLYRRYPDRASIAVALLDEHERELQEQLLRGEPPLGPGAPPAERLAAFYAAMVGLLEDHRHLVLGSEALTDILLAPLAPDVYGYQRSVLCLTPGQIITCGFARRSHVSRARRAWPARRGPGG